MTAMPEPSVILLKPWRCWKCGAMLARLWLEAGCTVEVKCKCNAMNVASIPRIDSKPLTP